MYNRVLKRPMFKRGGSSYQSQGTGITSPFDTPRPTYYGGGTIGGGRIQGKPMGNRTGFQEPTWEEIYGKMRKATQDPRGDFSYAAQGFSELASPYKESGEAKTIGEMLYAGASNVRGSRDKATDLERTGELAILESQGSRKMQSDQMAQELKIAELKAKGEKEFIVEQINSYWDPIILAESDPKKKKTLEDQKRSDTYNVIVLGEDISDKYKILTNEAAYSLAVGNAESEIATTINPTTKANWLTSDTGYNEALQILINKYLRLATKFLDPDKKASGGRVGLADSYPGTVQQASLRETIDTPQGDINVSETVEKIPQETNEINISYEQLRNRLPPEIKDDIVLLLSQSYEAFADFAEIQTQADVNEFNIKYNVQLFLPQQTGV